MELPTQRLKAKTKDPRLITIFGQSKVGKSTKLSELPNCLIIDTEQGTDFLDGMIVQINSMAELRQLPQAIAAANHTYDFGAIDTLDQIVSWVEREIVQEQNMQQKDRGTSQKIMDISEIPYGAGYAMVRNKVMRLITALKYSFPKLIIIGHRKKTIIGESKVEFSSSSLDLTGKLRNLICADSDAIGYVFRDKQNDLRISFQTSDELEVGSRCEHLRGKILDFEWQHIYPDTLKKTAAPTINDSNPITNAP
jgi:hypothetical protein